MIPNKVEALFLFIDFLYSNIENFNKYNGLINELEQLSKQRDNLKPRNNYKDKLEFDKVQKQINTKFSKLQKNTANLIKTKARELEVCSFENEPSYGWNGIHNDIENLKRNFSSEDLGVIFSYKSKYIQYRERTHKTFLSLSFFFEDLDEISKSLFNYFKDSDSNEFENFEEKEVEANSWLHAIELFRQGNNNIQLPTGFLNSTLKGDAEINKPFIDTRYLINEDFEDRINQHKNLKYQFEKDGFYSIELGNDKVRLFNPEIAIILTSKELNVTNLENQQNEILNGCNYFLPYADGFKEGEHEFENNFKASVNTLYGPNAEQYVKDLQHNYFHASIDGIKKGWKYAITQYPLIITHEAVKKLGYYSGLVSKVEDLIKTSPELFKDFYSKGKEKKYEKELVGNKVESESPKTFEELFYDANSIPLCIDVLKQVEPPLIDSECNYIGGLKGAFCVWVKEMQRQGFVKHFSDRKVFALLLPQKIKRFSIDESMFGKSHTKAEKQYRTDMKTLLSQIKLSQNSQKG